MKKLMIIAAVAATALAACAAPLNPKTATEAQVRATLTEVLGSSNRVFKAGLDSKLWLTLRMPRFRGIMLEAEDTLAKKGVVINPWWVLCATAPKMSALARSVNGADAAYQKSIAIAKRLGCNIFTESILTHGGTMDDVAVLLEESVAFPTNCYLGISMIDSAKKAIQGQAIKAAKKMLRKMGKSFVTKNGVNPCEELVSGLTAALNAPRFAGLDAWLKGVGYKGVDLSRLPSEAVVAKLREDIVNGDKEMSHRDKAVLYVCLGVDGYNAFVREYNGE